ncbi:IS3 family transposase [Bacteroidales bacterium OttesenSCG-928-K03]|nr:IS3 family transposase [Odoribacter sp. OttesenSCG-928-L07]MDL2238782.1 IS3 family transposase [Bacteroidales bacterium OttesenSCG-928-L14]MDL2243111.1 IS3 family transposase [Bacteroidales bacterium OttesenSCG-928-K03]
MLAFDTEGRRKMIEKDNSKLSINRQCAILGINRSGFYYKPCGENPINLDIMEEIDTIHTKYPYYGIRKILVCLKEKFPFIGKKRVSRLMHKMNIHVVYPKKNTSVSNPQHKIYPYLLCGLRIDKTNQVWETDITYIRMRQGFMYLMAIVDVHSRYVLNWSISNTMDKDWCVSVLSETISLYGTPEIFNTDQGSQFTSLDFTNVLKDNNIKISMDGRGRATDNIYIERLWRSVKYENIYLNAYETGQEL